MRLYWTTVQARYSKGLHLRMEGLSLTFFFDPPAFAPLTLATDCCGVPLYYDRHSGYSCELCGKDVAIASSSEVPDEDFYYAEHSSVAARATEWLEVLTSLDVLSIDLVARDLARLVNLVLSLDEAQRETGPPHPGSVDGLRQLLPSEL